MTAVNYLWNPINDNIVREFDDSGNTVAEYTTESDLYGNTVSQYRDGNTSYLHFDCQGNTTELTNDAGSVTDTIRYSAFGDVRERTGTTESPFLYIGRQGYYWDIETGDYSVRRRPLSTTGRWLVVDPLGFIDGFNLYAYAANDPMSMVDPGGTIKKKCKCPNCGWSFGGASGNLSLVAGLTYARVTARCLKAELRAYRVYNCG